MAHNEDAPFETFRLLYSLASWAGLALLLAVLAWLVVTLVTNAPSGTARTRELEAVRPTAAALAARYGGEEVESGTVKVVDLPAVCAACHAIEGTSASGTICPDLTHIGSVSEARLASDDYTGSATTVAEYIRESILDPNVFLVEGEGYATGGGTSLMTAAVGAALSERELNDLVAYLASLE